MLGERFFKRGNRKECTQCILTFSSWDFTQEYQRAARDVRMTLDDVTVIVQYRSTVNRV